MVPTAISLEQAVRRYDRVSWIYSFNAALGSGTSVRALDLAGLEPGDAALELGVGTGRDVLRLADRVGAQGRVYGIEMSRGMLAVARDIVARSPIGGRVALQLGDARRLPYPADSFDVVFASRVLDLIDTPDIPVVLAECRRVLKPAGRLVLAHMSKLGAGTSWFERLYTGLPLFGGWLFVCRPVLVLPELERQGFRAARREYHRTFPVGTEIVVAVQPADPTD